MASSQRQEQLARPQQRGRDQKRGQPARMPKARALALARTCKKWLMAASLAGFIALSGLAASHQVGATARASSGASQNAASTTTASSQGDDGFFNQEGENHFGASNSLQGSSNVTQAPVTGSSVS